MLERTVWAQRIRTAMDKSAEYYTGTEELLTLLDKLELMLITLVEQNTRIKESDLKFTKYDKKDNYYFKIWPLQYWDYSTGWDVHKLVDLTARFRSWLLKIPLIKLGIKACNTLVLAEQSSANLVRPMNFIQIAHETFFFNSTHEIRNCSRNICARPRVLRKVAHVPATYILHFVFTRTDAERRDSEEEGRHCAPLPWDGTGRNNKRFCKIQQI